MKAYYAILSLLLTIQVLAQEQPGYEKKSFHDETGKIYWNLDLPVYIQIASSGDMNNSITLEDVKKQDMKKFANPLHFDGHGVHYIRHFDYESPIPEKEVAYEINVDGIAPKTMITLKDAPYFFNNKVYYGKNLQAVLNATDEMSGIQEIFLSVNTMPYAAYNEAIAFGKQGEYLLKFYAVDRVGNMGKAETKNFVVDVTPPSTSHSISVDHLNETILSPRSKVKLKSEDELSGVKSVKLKIDNGAEIGYVQEIALPGLLDGEHELQYAATDQVKNAEDFKKLNFYYDATPPEVTSSFNGNFAVGETVSYIAGNATFSLAATDNKAGVKDIYYSINGGEPHIYSEPINIPKQGAYVVKFKSSDNVNNQTVWKTNNQMKNIFVDDKAPMISHSYKGPVFFTRDTVFITRESLVVLSATDSESGMLAIEYQSDNKNSQTYTEPFSQTAEGFHSINFSGIDQVKNTRSGSFFYVVDSNGPEIYYHTSLSKIGTQHLEQKETNVSVFASGTLFYLAATDKLVGTKSIYYQIDNAQEVLYTSPIKLTQKGLHTIKIKAFDNLNNKSEMEMFEFVVQ